METYLFELPTTGDISFAEIFEDASRKYTTHISAATSARASLKTALKESKRTDGEKDYLKIILDDYLPYLYAAINTAESGKIIFNAETQTPVFSWRTTLSSNIFQSSPRIPVRGLAAELSFSLLTYAFALSNLARSTVISLGDYEHERHISDADRQSKDAKLNFAVNLLQRASSVYLHVADVVLPQCNMANVEASKRVPDMNKDVVTALSHLALADAQKLAIRKLMTKAAYDSVVSPGPPLPKSHPSPGLIAKLYIHIASEYSSARSLAKTHGDGVSSDLRKYLANEIALSLALVHKWLGVEAGESGSGSRAGAAVGFLKWAKSDLDGLAGLGKNVSLGKTTENSRTKKSRIVFESESVASFLKHYQNLNNSVHFQQVPPTSELQSSIPTGKSAITSKSFESPRPAFGPGSLAHPTEQFDGDSRPESNADTSSYARAGSYF
ncbi:hypothetical protein BU17DRAFT_46560 [Hysterangium stoloniferum]|nr:hypothetical protein BU17DRAFT_46560 [Hysterangium stoloniferum]